MGLGEEKETEFMCEGVRFVKEKQSVWCDLGVGVREQSVNFACLNYVCMYIVYMYILCIRCMTNNCYTL